MRLAVVGHVEWVSFLLVDRAPKPGGILHASNTWDEPAGGGGVAAAELARLGGSSTLFTALGSDELGQGLPEAFRALGVDVVAAVDPDPHRRAVTLLDPSGERTIVVVGPSQSPRGKDHIGAFSGVDAVYFCKGDAAMLQEARQARILVATARELSVVREADVRLDALVLSSCDPRERYSAGDLRQEPDVVAITDGENGGSYTTRDGQSGRWPAVSLTGPIVDTYGAGDCFAAGLTWALASGLGVEAALELAAERGALTLSRRGAHGVPVPRTR